MIYRGQLIEFFYALIKRRGAMTSASAKKLKFDLIQSQAGEDYK